MARRAKALNPRLVSLTQAEQDALYIRRPVQAIITTGEAVAPATIGARIRHAYDSLRLAAAELRRDNADIHAQLCDDAAAQVPLDLALMLEST